MSTTETWDKLEATHWKSWRDYEVGILYHPDNNMNGSERCSGCGLTLDEIWINKMHGLCSKRYLDDK